MNILFMSLLDFDSISTRNIYTDLLRQFIKDGHKVHVISPIEKRTGKASQIIEEEGCFIYKPVVGNIQKTSFLEKGISTITLESKLTSYVKKQLADIKIDLILYTTPPITFQKTIVYLKKKHSAKTYLLLKDIFPQNAVDLGALSKTGIKGLIYKYFRQKERRLYQISDYIGCMSQANVDYVLKHNSEIDASKVEVCPNCIEVIDKSVDIETRNAIRNKYKMPLDKMVFVYGGNLGKPQGIPFIIECLKKVKDIEEAFFLIVGDGTEYSKLEEYVNASGQFNLMLMNRIPKEDYDTLVGACDVGLIFLDYRFTIPNFPSRLLSYMQAKLPVLAVTDSNTDIGQVITEGDFGWWCESDDAEAFKEIVTEILSDSQSRKKGLKGFEYLQKEYSVDEIGKKIEGKKWKK